MGVIADKIRRAIFGGEVRDSIANGIEVVEQLREDYDRQVINAGNSNAEIVDARGGEAKLKDRLDKVDSHLEQKAEQSEVNYLRNTKAEKNEVFSMANMGQDIKEAMTGGSVAIVGKHSVLPVNVNENAIEMSHINLNNINLLNVYDVIKNKYIAGYNESGYTLEDKTGYCYVIIPIPEVKTSTIRINYSDIRIGQRIIFLNSKNKRLRNISFSDLDTNTYPFINVSDDKTFIDINIGIFITTQGYSDLSFIGFSFLMSDSNYIDIIDGYRLKGKTIKNVLPYSSYPFNQSADFQNNGFYATTLRNAIKDIKLFNVDKTEKVYLRLANLNPAIEEEGFNLAISKVIDVGYENITNFFVKINNGLQKYDFEKGYVVIDTDNIDMNEITTTAINYEYEHTAISPLCFSSDKNINYFLEPLDFYLISDVEQDIYLKNISYSKIDDFYIRLGDKEDAISYGAIYDKRKISLTRKTADKQVVTFNVNKKDSDNNKIGLLKIPIRVASKEAKDGENIKCLFIGDSLIDNGTITSKLLELFSEDVTTIKLIGTRGDGLNKHEGRSGWSSYDIRYTNSYNDRDNAFINPNSNEFDFSYYISNNSFEVPDIVVWQVGVNDIFRPMDGTKTVENIQAMIDNIHNFNPSIKIVIATLPQPYLGDANYNSINNFRPNIYAHYFRLDVSKEIQDAFGNRNDENIFIAPIHCVVDTDYNFKMSNKQVNKYSTQTEEICTDITHPKHEGYYQIADQYHAVIKNI